MTRVLTGLVTEKCYAASLQDCDGGPPTGEHFINEALLIRMRKRWGTRKMLTVSGLPWCRTGRLVTPEKLQTYVLCDKHNNILSREVDQSILQLFDALIAIHDGQGARVSIRGELLERWSMKLLAGLMASGNVARAEGGREPKTSPGAGFSETLFHGTALPNHCGFYFIEQDPTTASRPAAFEARVHVIEPGEPGGGKPWGISVQVLGVMWTMALRPMRNSNIHYRPPVLDFGPLGSVELTWAHPTPTKSISLTVRPRSPMESGK